MIKNEIKESFKHYQNKKASCAEEFITVRYGETDQMGVVYHANYLLWFNIVRDKLFEELGIYVHKMEKMEILSPVIEANCFYSFPAFYPDKLLLQCIMKKPERIAQIILYYRIVRKRDGKTICFGKTINALMNKKGKIFLEFPPELITMLKKVNE